MKGRIAIHEVIPVDNQMEELITNAEGNLPVLEDFVRERGYLSIKQDGIMKALLGLTTLSELERVTEGALMLENEHDMSDEETAHKALAGEIINEDISPTA